MQYGRHTGLEATGRHLLQVLQPALGIDRDLSPDPLRIQASPFQFQLQIMIIQLLIGSVLVYESRLVDIVYHQVEVSVIVQVGISGPIAIGRLRTTPLCARIAETQVAIIAKYIIL